MVRADGFAYRFSPALGEWARFYVVGKTIYPVAPNGAVAGYQWGVYEQTSAQSTITWDQVVPQEFGRVRDLIPVVARGRLPLDLCRV